MFGDKLLGKTFRVTKEASEQFRKVDGEINTLANLTGKSWHLTEDRLFDKVRYVSFVEGAATVCVGAAVAACCVKIWEKHKIKKFEKGIENLDSSALE